MSCRTQQDTAKRKDQQQLPVRPAVRNDKLFLRMFTSIIQPGTWFEKKEFHGNIEWCPEEVVIQSIVCSWQEAKNVTDAFDQSLEICTDLKLKGTIQHYNGLMNALTRYQELFHNRLRDRLEMLTEEVAGERRRTDGWLLPGFDGSRISAPRTQSNEKAFCAPNYGKGKEARYGRKKSKGMRRNRNIENPPQPPKPQVWVTLVFDMSCRIPLQWKLGPSNASERDHVKAMLAEKKFPEKTPFCGDAGFVGYPLWSAILKAGQNFNRRLTNTCCDVATVSDFWPNWIGRFLRWPWPN
jgi:hypothetical protein